MIEETGVVVSLLADDRVLVRVRRQRACSGCESSARCGTGLLGEVASQVWEDVMARTTGGGIQPGDTVTLGVSERVVWQGMLLLYGLPVLAMGGGGVAGQMLTGELGAIAGAIGGLVAGLLWVRIRSSRHGQDKFLPIVIKKRG